MINSAARNSMTKPPKPPKVTPTPKRATAEQVWLSYIGALADATLTNLSYNDQARLAAIRLAVRYALAGQVLAGPAGPTLVEVAARVDILDGRLVKVENYMRDAMPKPETP